MATSKEFTDAIASGASTSGGIALGANRYGRVMVQVSSMSTAAAVGLQHTLDGTNYYNVFHESIASSTVGTPQMFIASGVGSNGGVTKLPVGGFQTLRFVATATVANGVVFKVICSD